MRTVLRRDPAEVQGAYFLATGIWPIVHLRSFTRVTGPKREGWLVKTIGAVLAVIGATLLSAHRRGRVTPEVRKLGYWSALSLTLVDVYYVAKRRISPVYLLDALVEVPLVRAQWQRSQEPDHTPCTASSRTAGTHGRWNIRPGESLGADGKRDKVAEGSMESFPASDPPSYVG